MPQLDARFRALALPRVLVLTLVLQVGHMGSSGNRALAQAALSLSPDSARLSCMRSMTMDLVAAPHALEGVEALIIEFDERILEIDALDVGALSVGGNERPELLRWRVSPLSSPGRLRLEPNAEASSGVQAGQLGRLTVRGLVAGTSDIRLWQDKGAHGQLSLEAASVQVTCAGMTPVPPKAVELDAPEADVDQSADAVDQSRSAEDGTQTEEGLVAAAGTNAPGEDSGPGTAGLGDGMRSIPPPPAALPVAGHAKGASGMSVLGASTTGTLRPRSRPVRIDTGESTLVGLNPSCWLTMPPSSTLVDLALRRGTTVLDVARSNRLPSLRAARAGTLLRVPGCRSLKGGGTAGSR